MKTISTYWLVDIIMMINRTIEKNALGGIGHKVRFFYTCINSRNSLKSSKSLST